MFKKLKQRFLNWLKYDTHEITIEEFHVKFGQSTQIKETENGKLKFIEESVPYENVEIESHDGWNSVLSVFKTIKYEIWQVETENGDFLECADHHLLINKSGNPVRLNSLQSGQQIQTKTGLQKIKRIIKTERHEHMYDAQLSPDTDHTFFTNNILSHNTTSSAAFILFFILFNKNKEVAILANKQPTTKEILDRIKNMYRHLPIWLKPGVKEWNKHSVEFENGCKIIAASTSSSSISGKSISLLYIDEFALIAKNVIEDFIDSTFPVIAAAKTSRILISSTPKGKNHFYRFFMDAKHKEKTKSPFIAKEIAWDAPPGRDLKWREEKIRELGSVEKFNQEYGGDFLDTCDMLINGNALEHIERTYRMPPLDIKINMNGQSIKGLKIYEKPVPKLPTQKEHVYVLCADVAEGKEQDSSAISIIDVTTAPFKQVASFKNNEINLIEFPYVIYQLAVYYNYAYVVVENNSVGSGVVKDLWFELEYPNMVNLNFVNETKLKHMKYWELGVKTTKKSKKQGALHMKYLIENYKLIIHDAETIDELYHFVQHYIKGTYSAEEGYHDDLVMTLILFSYMAKTQMYFRSILNGVVSDEDVDPDTVNPFVLSDCKNELTQHERNKLKEQSVFIQNVNGTRAVTKKDQDIENAKTDISWLF